jgi:hypothetical protein
MSGNSPENVSRDFEELFAFLSARKVRALIVGGYAFAYHARPRYTKDIDLWIEATPDNAARLLEALSDFGFGSLDLSIEDFTKPGQIVQLGFPPNRIDFLTSIKGVTFEEAWEARIEDLFGATTVCYLGRDDLIRSKKAAGRAQDQADVAILEFFREGRTSDEPESL